MTEDRLLSHLPQARCTADGVTISGRVWDRAAIAAEIAALLLKPGERVPDDWRRCPLCYGDGCQLCQGCGRVHPRRVSWIEDELARRDEPLWLIEQQWLADRRLPARADRWYAWLVAQSEAAEALLQQWAEEDGHPEDFARWEANPPPLRLDDA